MIDYQQLYEQELVSKKELLEVVEHWKTSYQLLKYELDQVKKLIYGSRHERFTTAPQNPAQLSLDIQAEAVQATSLTSAQQISYTRKGTQQPKPSIAPVRTKLPDNLPRVPVILEPTAVPDGAVKIREEQTEELDYQPGHFFVRQYIRPVYVSKDTFVIADLPSRPLPKAIAGAGLLAQIVIDKYVDHLPLHREGYSGYLQTDGYNVYNIIAEQTEATLLHCWAHGRRYFYDALQSDPEQAQHGLSLIGKLYDIERQAKEEGLSFDQIKELRESQAAPVLNELKAWMTQGYMTAKPKTPVAIGRKNYLFAGSHEAAKRSAMLYSLLGTCKLHGINPFEWLRDSLQKINDHPINRIHELLPIKTNQ